MAKLARLQAEIDNGPRVRFPETLVARKANPDVSRILQREEDHFRARNVQLREQVEKLQEQKRQAEAEITSLERQLMAADQSLKYLREQETSYAGLVEKNFVAPVRMLDARRQVSEKEEKKFEYEALRSQARQKLADVQLRLGQINTGRYADNSRDMVETQTRILNLQERQLPFKDSLKKRTLSAPAAGVVNAVRVHTEGGVIAPRETILEITPETSGMIAEVRISPADVDEVRSGQDVEVEFSGMNRRVTSLVKGRDWQTPAFSAPSALDFGAGCRPWSPRFVGVAQKTHTDATKMLAQRTKTDENHTVSMPSYHQGTAKMCQVDFIGEKRC
jgi:HlyD family secretion protein